MDVIRGDFGFDYKTGQVSGKVGVYQPLDPEIANEGTKVELLDGDEIAWTPPAAKPVIPDWSEIKTLKKYFSKTGYKAFPAWFYGPNGEEKIFETKEEAAKAGIRYRKATFEEKGRYGIDHAWEQSPDCKWSSIPYPGTRKFDPNNVGAGKNYIARPPDPKIAENELLAKLIPAVTASVVAGLRESREASAPPHIDQARWQKFLAFEAWEKTQEALKQANEPSPEDSAIQQEASERAEWLHKAADAGIKVDGRWKLDKIRKAVMKELEKRVREAEQANETPEAA